jgi:hypothetical protein
MDTVICIKVKQKVNKYTSYANLSLVDWNEMNLVVYQTVGATHLSSAPIISC